MPRTIYTGTKACNVINLSKLQFVSLRFYKISPGSLQSTHKQNKFPFSIGWIHSAAATDPNFCWQNVKQGSYLAGESLLHDTSGNGTAVHILSTPNPFTKTTQITLNKLLFVWPINVSFITFIKFICNGEVY